MAMIEISNLNPAGSDLFASEESFLTELQVTDSSQVFGGGHKGCGGGSKGGRGHGSKGGYGRGSKGHGGGSKGHGGYGGGCGGYGGGCYNAD
jgi:hypothetical protein